MKDYEEIKQALEKEGIEPDLPNEFIDEQPDYEEELVVEGGEVVVKA